MQLTGRIGYSAVLIGGLFMCAICTGVPCSILCEQGGVSDIALVIEVASTGHERERVLPTCQSYNGLDAVDYDFILEEKVHVETTHYVDNATPHNISSSSHEARVGRVSGVDFDGLDAIGRVLLPQLISQLLRLSIVTVKSAAFRCRQGTGKCW
ncbi:MAG: hypothetical protein M3H12_00545 [Chromatiales bacterium]